MEKQRLQDNFNRVPKDIAFMTKTEQDLKREMCLAIDDAYDFLEVRRKELKRLRREHYENNQHLAAFGDEIQIVKNAQQEITKK